MKKRIISIVVAFCLCSTLVPATAIDSDSVAVQDSAQIADVQSIAQTNFSLNEDDVTMDAPETWIQVEDLEGRAYGVFSLLYDDFGEICGYSVVSTVGERPTLLVSGVGESAATHAKAIVAYSDDKPLIYQFPEVFITMESDEYYKICIDGSLELIEDTSMYESTVVDRLYTSSNIVPQSRETIYGSLDDWDEGMFVPITNNRTTYYGGNQKWLVDEGISEKYADKACAAIAAANMFYYLSTHISTMKNLYTTTGITKSQFSAFQREVYDYVTPSPVGIPFGTVFASGVEKYASSRGVSLKGEFWDGSWNETNVINYIRTGLNKERPVMVISWNTAIPELVTHWVTATRLYNDGTGNKLVVSTYGSKFTFDFSLWVNEFSAYRGALYFN